MDIIAKRVVNQIVQHYKDHPDDIGQIKLFGFSRGGVTAARIAHLLSKELPAVSIAEMLLIDPVPGQGMSEKKIQKSPLMLKKLLLLLQKMKI